METAPVADVGSALTYPFVCYCCGALYQERLGFCLKCGRMSLIHPRSFRPLDLSGPQARASGVSARVLEGRAFDRFQAEAFPDLVLSDDAFIVVSGPSSGGKSSWAALLAQGRRPSAYFALETGVGPALQSMLSRLEIRDDDLTFYGPDSAADLFEVAKGVKLVAIDSVTVSLLQPPELLRLARSGTIVVAIIQHNKRGVIGGWARWEYDADIIIRVEKMKWKGLKSRLQELPFGGEVLCTSARK